MNDTYNDFTKNFFGSKTPTQEPFNFNNDYNLWQSLGYSPLDAKYDSFSKNSFSFSGNATNNNFFASKGFANAMAGVGMLGSALGGIGGILAAREQKKFNKKVLELEEQQRNRIYAREDANNKALNQGLNAFFKQKKDNL